MRKFSLLGIVLAVLVQFPASAGQPEPCRNPDFDHFGHEAEALRDIARQCADHDMARLYFNRAYHLDLIRRAHAQSDLIGYSPRYGEYLATPERVRQITTYRLYMAFIEAMAPHWFAEPAERVAFLNSQYDRQGELAELRLKGYDHLADYKERQARQRRDN